MQVSTISTSLHKQLSYDPDVKHVGTQVLNDVAGAVSKVKTLIGWLDRYPFQGKTLINLHPSSVINKLMVY